MGSGLKTLLREPLFHFVLLGIAIFVINGWLADPDSSPDSAEIVLSADDIEAMKQRYQRTWQRPPSPDELAGLVQEQIREEVYVREAIALGLDQGDSVIRAHLRQKMAFLTDDLVALADPSDAELEAYRVEHAQSFMTEPQFTFSQIYFDPARLEDAETELTKLRQRLEDGGSVPALPQLGHRTMLPTRLNQVSGYDIARQLGRAFVDRLMALDVGRWQGPVESGYGLHLVYIEEKVPPALPPLSTIRDAVLREWQHTQRALANEAFFQQLLSKYQVRVDGTDVGAPWPTP